MTKKCIFSQIKEFPTLLNQNLEVFSMNDSLHLKNPKMRWVCGMSRAWKNIEKNP